jgi:protein O-mannosyl-transferase
MKSLHILRLLNNQKVQISIIVLLTIFAFSNIFLNSFVGDDFDFIVNWELTRDLSNIPEILKGSVPYGHEGVYRPIRGLFYLISFQLWGTNITAYHLQAIVIHLTCTILVYFLTKAVTKNKYVPFTTAILFGVHPIHVEAITFITTSFDKIGAIFFFLSLLLYTKIKGSKLASANFYYSLGFAFLAFFTYEITLVLPAILIIFDICFKKINIEKIKKTYFRYLPFIGLALFYAAIRIFLAKAGARSIYQADSFLLNLFISAKALLIYLRLLFIPVNLSINHTIPSGIFAHTFPKFNKEAVLNQSIFELNNLIAFASIAFICFTSYKSLRRFPIITFGLIWFVIALLPVLNIIPNSNLLSEKYAYISSYGICLLLASSLLYIPKTRPKILPIVSLFLIATTASYLTITYSRNKDWKNEVVLWEKTVLQSPLNSMVHYKLGSAYRDEGRFDEAVQSYLTTLYLTPDFDAAYINLGVIAEKQDDLAKARYFYKKALAIDPDVIETNNNLGVIYWKEDYLEEAIDYYQKALSIDPNYPQAQINIVEAYSVLGTRHAQKGEFVKALELLQNALSINPHHPEVLNNIGTIYASEGNRDEAIRYYEKAILVDPDFEDAHINLERAKDMVDWVLD